MGLFRKSNEGAALEKQPPRVSSGWGDILSWLKQSEGLRVLDFGPTSPPNINFLTGLGHSVYMANIVEDAARPEWKSMGEDGKSQHFDVERFVQQNLNFSGREFDVVLLWDTADYLPAELVPALFAKLREVLRPHGRLLAFFHGAARDVKGMFARYQLTDGKELVLISIGSHPLTGTYNSRQIEQFLSGYADIRFFLAKDNVREVIAQR